ncbi:MAG: methylenetetrahydrofolate reductase [Treponema sp.]|jgi:methylenetetrahydrofolate reductase (NADPH)|nr:methylenetetrahydrofolate reductase [Treponema sp.]
MLICDILHEKETIISCEIFPPKIGEELKHAFEIAGKIASLKPAFISVTCNTGTNPANYTEKLAQHIEQSGVPALAHLTCVAAAKESVSAILDNYAKIEIKNVLALRGDLPKNLLQPEYGHYMYANELIAAIKARGGFCIGGACYPEGHVENVNQDEDIKYLKQKVDAGCDFLATQMFFDNNVLYKFLYKLSQKGINVPVLAGIMPVTNSVQIRRIVELSGTVLPSRFQNILDKFGNKPDAMRQAGIAYATEQIIDLIANNVRGVHIYAMNKPDVAAQIMQNLSHIV